jgi:3-oxoacyl-[acyl-carrier-protein] synthase-3
LNVNGLTGEWIEQRTGIVTRSKAEANENINTMSVKALQNAFVKLPYNIGETDLIISASYSPYDTVATAAHHVQRTYQIKRAKAFYISSACSSFISALEIAEGYFAMNKASKAMILAADKNTAYSNVSDPQTGHLWGDAAAVFFVSREKICETDSEILDIYTEGLGHVGKGTDAVMMRPRDGGIIMPDGRDVFVQACTYMQKNVLFLLEKNGYTLEQLSYFICHQANMRILNNIARHLLLPKKRFLHNIEKYGNTGSVSSALVYAQNEPEFCKDDLIAISVFGGGYSAGACLIKY